MKLKRSTVLIAAIFLSHKKHHYLALATIAGVGRKMLRLHLAAMRDHASLAAGGAGEICGSRFGRNAITRLLHVVVIDDQPVAIKGFGKPWPRCILCGFRELCWLFCCELPRFPASARGAREAVWQGVLPAAEQPNANMGRRQCDRGNRAIGDAGAAGEGTR